MELPSIRAGLIDAGFARTHETTKVEQYTLGRTVVYLKKAKAGRTSIGHPLVLHGDCGTRLRQLRLIPGVKREKPDEAFYHNANMSAFELRRNRGLGETRYGVDFEIGSRDALTELLKAIS